MSQQTPKVLAAGPQFTIFRWILGITVLLGAIFVLASIIYSIWTWLPDLFRTGRYHLRRGWERASGKILGTMGIAAIGGTIPLVYQTVQSYIESLSITTIGIGILSGIWGFMKSGKQGSKGIPIGLIAVVGSTIFLYGILVGAFGIAVWIDTIVISTEPIGATDTRLVAAGVILSIAVVVGFFVDVNYISVHRFYRDRLMETFLPDLAQALTIRSGAANASNTFPMSEAWNTSGDQPFHIINTNLILVDSTKRVFRARGGDNFIFSPAFAGSRATGWRPMSEYMDGQMRRRWRFQALRQTRTPGLAASGRHAMLRFRC